jgi:hypothetical protein
VIQIWIEFWNLKRAVTVEALLYIDDLKHFRSHAQKKQHQVPETVDSTVSQLFASSRGIEEKKKKRRNYVEEEGIIEKPKTEAEEERPLQY